MVLLKQILASRPVNILQWKGVNKVSELCDVVYVQFAMVLHSTNLGPGFATVLCICMAAHTIDVVF